MRFINVIILIAFLASCSSSKEEENQKDSLSSDSISLTPEQIQNAGIQMGEVTMEVMNAELQVNGIVDVPPQNMISVSFPLGGYLKSTDLLPGMHINKNQVIARIEDPSLVQLQQDYLIARTRLEYLEREFERQKTLSESEVSSVKVYQQTKADFTSQKILLKGLAEKLRLIRINPDKLNEDNISRSVSVYSPINGYVSKVNVNIGRYVNPSEVLFELINPVDLHAALTVFEKDLSNVHPGQKVKVSFVENPAETYDCEVLLVTKNVDENRSAMVHCHFEDQPKQLLPGMFIKAQILLDRLTVLAVPETAVVRYGESEFLFLLNEADTYKMIQVETGIRHNGKVE
ncbi:MAG: efflux RND transporter periplasmic adaptor subunit, partial [Chitinophagaceae bacterium]|nr:efflux RND transporter periplasmic adaptor subunit [Chitinophagaceae bacterium]